jgi:hypothetical protein
MARFARIRHGSPRALMTTFFFAAGSVRAPPCFCGLEQVEVFLLAVKRQLVELAQRMMSLMSMMSRWAPCGFSRQSPPRPPASRACLYHLRYPRIEVSGVFSSWTRWP